MPSLPHFEGFPKSALKFLADLKQNNNKEWFEANRDTFDNDVIAPAQAFVAALGEHLKTLHPGIGYDTRANGSGSLFRIYRDVRFSKDKTPYKTHIGMKFWFGKKPKKTDNPGFYVGFGADSGGVYAGMWEFPKPLLDTYRKVVDDVARGEKLAAILNDLSAKGFETGETHYKRVPRGFDHEHPNADLLRRNAVHAAMPNLKPKVLTSDDLLPTCFDHCRTMWPLVKWIDDNVA